MPAVQMNVRMDRDMKAIGDDAFLAAGYTPTEVVRDLWGFAGRHRHDGQAIQDMIDLLKGREAKPAEGEEHRIAQFAEWLERGPKAIQDACVELGIDLDKGRTLADDALLEEAYDEEIERMWGAK